MGIIFFHLLIMLIFYASNSLKKIKDVIKEISFGKKNLQLLQINNMNKVSAKNITKKQDKQKEKKEIKNSHKNSKAKIKTDTKNPPKRTMNISNNNYNNGNCISNTIYFFNLNAKENKENKNNIFTNNNKNNEI